jgi:hypothetical protein
MLKLEGTILYNPPMFGARINDYNRTTLSKWRELGIDYVE